MLLLIFTMFYDPDHLAEVSAAYTLPESEGELPQTGIQSNLEVVLVEDVYPW